MRSNIFQHHPHHPRVVFQRKGRAFVARFTISRRTVRSQRFRLSETPPTDDGAG